ncbi:diphosphomevalonate decarboxylase [Zooshikella sp. RANM57]|uniref:diphosphomevalonate decarboxylase n=1 Tax=Zooshikella sp. RANM57 TaxID=3425863 RepID=UPI003D6EF1E5
MFTKQDVVRQVLRGESLKTHAAEGQAFAPMNIALCKYWGKRNTTLNLPVTSSVSLTLGSKGTYTRVKLRNALPKTDAEIQHDVYMLNGKLMDINSPFSRRLHAFLDLFRHTGTSYYVETNSDIPLDAGLASSACGFAALVQALDHLYGWHLDKKELSILARLGSGSAVRSLWPGFVEWKKGSQADGMDSHGTPLPFTWPNLRIGLYIINSNQKQLSSREAMQRTVVSSPSYRSWPTRIEHDLLEIKKAIEERDFTLFGKTVENNAIAMHAMMAEAKPPIKYGFPETLKLIQQVFYLRSIGLPVYFTQDAGPNLKLLFLASETREISKVFPTMEMIAPFPSSNWEEVILVDTEDRELGSEEKITAHRNAKLHRAFSVFIYRHSHNGLELLLQQRHIDKYHCGGLWSNTCCSHPRPGEAIVSAAKRRLKEEMGIEVDLQPAGKFIYKCALNNGLTEHEIDHILIGLTENFDEKRINDKEVQAYKWATILEIKKDLSINSNCYTPWFGKALTHHQRQLSQYT